jgi:hypothetical protein
VVNRDLTVAGLGARCNKHISHSRRLNAPAAVNGYLSQRAS